MAPSQRDRMRLIHFTLLCYNLRRRSCLSRIKTSGPQRRADRQHQETRNDEAHSGLPNRGTADRHSRIVDDLEAVSFLKREII